jgi:dihydroflavonol-4-reductase
MALVRAVAPVGGVLTRLTGSALLPTREAIHALESFPIIDGSKSGRELAHSPRPIEETLGDLHAFFAAAGRLGAARHNVAPAAG